ncbi:MAG: alpha/beta hydrolase [Clostridia bacterium]|nr:alpha/beta hydrolase [Clostridia bacterium]
MQNMIHVDVHYERAGVRPPDTPATLNLLLLPHLAEITMNPERPMVIVVPGGAYHYCSPREGEAIALKFLAEGIHAAVLRYSCAPCRYPTAALELAWAVQYCREHAAEWHVKPDAISVCGFSAGGHLAGTVGTLWEEPVFEQALGDGASWRPDSQILCYPVLTMGPFTHEGSRYGLLGAAEEPDNRLDALEKMSLENRVSDRTPPTFLWHTQEDGAVPVENSLMYAAALRRHKVPFELHIYEKGGHGISTCQEITSNERAQVVEDNQGWVDLAVRFVRRHWRGE